MKSQTQGFLSLCCLFLLLSCDDGPRTAPPACGNGILEAGETCDGADFGPQTCANYGLDAGTLACTAQCTIDLAGCHNEPICGDGVRDPDEACDDADFGDLTCASFGRDAGALACTAACTIDVSGCSDTAVCGNGLKEAGEACDLTDLGGLTCASLGFEEGTLLCAADCTVDTSTCSDGVAICGNDLRESGEVCDGTDLNGRSCISLGYDTGQLACDPGCTAFITSGCTRLEVCTNGIDDDGDTLVDCLDPSCAPDPSCQAGTCTEETVFHDSPPTCGPGLQCSIDENASPACLPDAMFAGGVFYGACGANAECPFGSICMGTSQLDEACLPFCQYETHPDCPGGGICLYSLVGSGLNLCALPDACDPVAGTGCPVPGEGCYLLDPLTGDSLCFTAGTVQTGDPCLGIPDCAPGNTCADPGSGFICVRLCDAATPCVSGTCQMISATLGFCG
ncbi:hypothetical protein KKD52_13900 [Myxococcota bacterium]|nr:hypothetical protein [Myxococcota bacterium]MBU1511449.1 hypothetical protein [Myxococcota bacterium]